MGGREVAGLERAAPAARAGCRSPGSRRPGRLPATDEQDRRDARAARAPATSSATLSPTWTAPAGRRPASASAAAKIAGSGLAAPDLGRGDDAVEHAGEPDAPEHLRQRHVPVADHDHRRPRLRAGRRRARRGVVVGAEAQRRQQRRGQLVAVERRRAGGSAATQRLGARAAQRQRARLRRVPRPGARGSRRSPRPAPRSASAALTATPKRSRSSARSGSTGGIELDQRPHRVDQQRRHALHVALCGRARDPLPMLSYAHGASPQPLLGETIGENLARTVAAHPEREAIVSCHQGVRLTYAEFDAEVDRVARALPAHRAGTRATGRDLEPEPRRVGARPVRDREGRDRAGQHQSGLPHHTSSVRAQQSGCRMLIAAARTKTSDYVAMVEEVRAELPALERAVFFDDPVVVGAARRRRGRRCRRAARASRPASTSATRSTSSTPAAPPAFRRAPPSPTTTSSTTATSSARAAGSPTRTGSACRSRTTTASGW